MTRRFWLSQREDALQQFAPGAFVPGLAAKNHPAQYRRDQHQQLFESKQFIGAERRTLIAFDRYGGKCLARHTQRHGRQHSAGVVLQGLVFDMDPVGGRVRRRKRPGQRDALFDGFVHGANQPLRQLGLRVGQIQSGAGQQPRDTVFVQADGRPREAEVGRQRGHQPVRCRVERGGRQHPGVQRQCRRRPPGLIHAAGLPCRPQEPTGSQPWKKTIHVSGAIYGLDHHMEPRASYALATY